MSSLSEKQGRRPLLPATDTSNLRFELFRLYGQQSAYRDLVVTKLRPQWKAVGLRPDATGCYDFAALQLAATAPNADALRRYVAAVRRHVAETLHLTHQDRPAEWAMEFVHAAVVNSAGRPDEDLFRLALTSRAPDDTSVDVPEEFRSQQSWLRVELSPMAAIVSAHTDPVFFLTKADLEEARWIFGSDWMGFSNWEGLAKQAHDLLDRELVRLQGEFEKQYRFVNRKSLANDRNVLMPVLFRWLYQHKAPPPNITRKRLTRLANRIGLDLPSWH